MGSTDEIHNELARIRAENTLLKALLRKYGIAYEREMEGVSHRNFIGKISRYLSAEDCLV